MWNEAAMLVTFANIFTAKKLNTLQKSRNIIEKHLWTSKAIAK